MDDINELFDTDDMDLLLLEQEDEDIDPQKEWEAYVISVLGRDWDKKDKRPPPKPRKNAKLYQAWAIWREVMEMRKRHVLRLSSILEGKSNLNADMERDFLVTYQLDAKVKSARNQMINFASGLGDVWEWITSIRGLASGGLAAQLLAQIDDIEKFATVSKLWAFSGWAVVDGKRQYCRPGQKAPYNRRLKSTCWLVGVQLIRQNNPVYRKIYDDAKARYQRKYPEPVKEIVTIKGKKKTVTRYSKGHIHKMALRIVIKTFLQHLWWVWRTADGLPVTKPYIHEVGGHTHYIPPPNIDKIFDVERVVVDGSEPQASGTEPQQKERKMTDYIEGEAVPDEELSQEVKDLEKLINDILGGDGDEEEASDGGE